MKEFIEDTDARIDRTIETLKNQNLSEEDRKENLSKLNNLLALKEIYIKIQRHSFEKELAL